MHRTASRQRMMTALIVAGFLALPRHDPARADEPVKAPGPILELRILATPKHDQDAIAKAQADELESPPLGYRWVVVSLTVKGKSPAFGEKTLTVPEARWKADAFQGAVVECRGKNLRGTDLVRRFKIVGNTADTFRLSESPKLYFQSIALYKIEAGLDRFTGEGLAVRDEPSARGGSRRWVLVKLDAHNVTEKDFRSVNVTEDDRNGPAVGFHFSRAGARKFSELTRAHLPEEGGAFQYHLGIIIEGRLVSAPVIRAEISDSGIIENMEPAAVDSLIEKLRASIGKP